MSGLEASFDRRVSDALIDAMSDASGLGVVVDFRSEDPMRCDILLVGTSDRESRASLYVGLTKVLDIRERRGRFRLTAHKTYSSFGSFDPEWQHHQELSEIAARPKESSATCERQVRPPTRDTFEQKAQSKASSVPVCVLALQ